MTPNMRNKAPTIKQSIPVMIAKSYKLTVLSFTALLLLSCAFHNFAAACPPQCPPCYYWNGSNCIYACDPDWCQTCQNGQCKSTCDSDNCQSCNGSGSCESNCDPNQCEQCDGEGNCESKCDPNQCEECDGEGNCEVCDGDPDKVCCDGTCCDKVWTKETVPAINDTCGPCNSGSGFCAKMIFDRPSYEQCVNVGVGQGGEHCECNETMQLVGYVYLCTENWDISMMLWCAAQGAWCALECSASGFDPATCANCLAGIDCCGGPCGVCDFVEECYPRADPLNEIHSLVFTSFGC